MGVAKGGATRCDGREELMGCREDRAVVEAAMAEWTAEAAKMEEGGGKPMLRIQVYSDAGFFDRGPEATGGYG